jgi:hypothetical protein
VLLLIAAAAAHIPFDRGTTTITEVDARPAADGGQWFEVRNDSGAGQNLVEQVFTDADGDTFQVALTVIVHDGDYAVFASPDSTVAADYHFPEGFDLRADAGAVVHTDLHGVVDEVVWDAGWGMSPTESWQVDAGVVANEWANDRPGNWCGGTGSPGAANTRCPGTDTDDDGDGWTELAGDCDDADARVFPGAIDWADPDANDADCDGVRDDGTGVDTGGVDTGDSGEPTDTGGDTGSTDTSTDTSDTSLADDADGDGFTADDCNDNDASVFPGSPDPACDGVDRNCDGDDPCADGGGSGAHRDADGPEASEGCGGGDRSGGAAGALLGFLLIARGRKAQGR